MSAAVAAPRLQAVPLGTQTHTLVYEARGSAARRAAIQQAFVATLPAFENVFQVRNVEVLVRIWEQPSADDPNLFAAAGYRATDTPGSTGCMLHVYRTRNQNMAELRFTLAHELVHCFQHALRPAMRTSPPGRHSASTDPDAWWIEGSAEYLASTRYPPAGPLFRRTVRDFAAITSQPVNRTDYGQYWFFAYLAHAGGLEAVSQLIRNIPMLTGSYDATIAAQQAWLERRTPTANTFRNYAATARRRSLPQQPPLQPTAYALAAFDSQRLQLLPMAIDTIDLTVPAPRQGYGLKVRLTDGTAQGYRVTLGSTEITSAGYSTCGGPPSRRLALAVGRGQATDENAAAQLSVEEVRCPVPITMAALAGAYQVVHTSGAFAVFVDTQAPQVDVEPYAKIPWGSSSSATIAPDGSVQLIVAGSMSTPDRYNAFHNARVHGHFQLGPTITGDQSAARLGVVFSTPLTGTSTGSGATIDAQGLHHMNPNVSIPLRFPPLDGLECANITLDAGRARCGMVTFLSGETPYLQLGRTP